MTYSIYINEKDVIPNGLDRPLFLSAFSSSTDIGYVNPVNAEFYWSTQPLDAYRISTASKAFKIKVLQDLLSATLTAEAKKDYFNDMGELRLINLLSVIKVSFTGDGKDIVELSNLGSSALSYQVCEFEQVYQPNMHIDDALLLRVCPFDASKTFEAPASFTNEYLIDYILEGLPVVAANSKISEIDTFVEINPALLMGRLIEVDYRRTGEISAVYRVPPTLDMHVLDSNTRYLVRVDVSSIQQDIFGYE